MYKFVQIFVLSGLFLGIMLYFAPEIFHGTSVQSSPPTPVPNAKIDEPIKDVANGVKDSVS